MARRADRGVRLVAGDTDRVTVGGGAHSGRGMRLGSIVIKKSSDEHHRERPAHRRASAGNRRRGYRIQDGRFAVKGTNHAVGLFEVARAARQRKDLPQDLQGPLPRSATRPCSTPAILTARMSAKSRSMRIRAKSADELCRGRRRRPCGQPHDHSRPGAWRHRPRRRSGAARACALRSGNRATPGRLVHGLRHAARHGPPITSPRSAKCPPPPIRSASARPAKAARSQRSPSPSTPSSMRCPTWASATWKCRRRRNECGRRSKTHGEPTSPSLRAKRSNPGPLAPVTHPRLLRR